MRKKILLMPLMFAIIAVCTLCVSIITAGTYFFVNFTGITGEVPGTIDNLWCSSPLIGGRDGWAVVRNGTEVSYWSFDFDATDPEDATHVHCKAGEWTQGVWERFHVSGEGGGTGTVDTTGTVNADEIAVFHDGDTLKALNEAEFKSAYNMEAGIDYLAPNGDGSNLTNVEAATGDSATGFFGTGAIEHERGGLEGDVSTYDGVLGISGGSVAEINTPALLETYAGLGSFFDQYASQDSDSGVRDVLGLDSDDDVEFGSIEISTSDHTGIHTDTNNAATLKDSSASFKVDALIGLSIYNSTDGSDGVITDNDATTVTATLAGGTDNDWDTNDAYTIGVHGGLLLDPYPDTDHRCTIVDGGPMQVDTTPGFGGCLVQATDFNFDSADADSDTTPCQAVHCDPYGNTGATIVMFKGHIRDDSWNWSAGWVYLGTDGMPTQTKPSGTGDIVQIIGRATSADTIRIKPSNEWSKLN